MNGSNSVKIGRDLFTIGQRIRMLTGGKGCDNDDIEACYNAGDMATIVQIERFRRPQGLGIGVQLESGIFNLFDENDTPPRYPFEPLVESCGDVICSRPK